MRDYAAIARKITRTLLFSQITVSAAFIAMATVSAIAGAQLSGRASWAGVPSAVLLLFTALGSLGWGMFMGRFGRRIGLTLGMLFGIFGSFIAGWGLNQASFSVFLGGLALLGFTQAAMQLGRFAAADVNLPEMRGRAIANVVVGGTVGSIVGPLLVAPSGQFALKFGYNELTGPYLLGLLLLFLAAVIIFFWLKPEPLIIAREITSNNQKSDDLQFGSYSIKEIFTREGVIVASSAMVIGQLVMIMLMVISTLYMKEHDHTLGNISLVISSHTFGMFAFSVISGRLADKFGRSPVILLGALTLFIASLSAIISPNLAPMAVSLFLLGFGWNFCYVGGSTLLADQLAPNEESRAQGFNDLLIGLASAVGSLLSGIIFASVGFRIMGIIAAVVSLIPFFLSLWWGYKQRILNPAH